MKKILFLSLLPMLLSVNSFSQDTPPRKGPPDPSQRPPLTEDQKKLRKEIVDKYDVNKDGKLDRDEMQKISETDRKKMRDAGLGPKPTGPKPEKPKK